MEKRGELNVERVVAGGSSGCRLAFAGRMLLEEAKCVVDADLRRALLVQALGSLAEVLATLENRMTRDAERLAAMGQDELQPGLAKCMSEALNADAAAYREVIGLRTAIYHELGEPTVARLVLCEHDR